VSFTTVKGRATTAAIENKKAEILRDMGISGRADVRLLETFEYNLLANRDGWGSTNTYEWTNTEYHNSGPSRRIIAGDSDCGGAAHAYCHYPSHEHINIGWRAAIVFPSENPDHSDNAD
jgi:hypothetical protein